MKRALLKFALPLLTACGSMQKPKPPIDSAALTTCAQVEAALCTQYGNQFPYTDGKKCQDIVSVSIATPNNKQEFAFCRKPRETIQIALCQAINKILDGLDISSHFDLEAKCETKKP